MGDKGCPRGRRMQQCKALAAFAASIANKMVTGKSTTITMSDKLGSDMKEYAIVHGQPIWAAVHLALKPEPCGGKIPTLYEDGTLQTPFVVSTQPFEVIHQRMEADIGFYKVSTGVCGALSGAAGLWAAYNYKQM